MNPVVLGPTNRLRRRISALSAAIAALAVAAAPSGASAQVPGGIGQGGQSNGPVGCVGPNAPSGIGDAGATFNQACGAALVFFGPSIGQVGTVIGPTIIGSTVVAPVTSSLGPVALSPLP
jgi:hypothetical protein